MKTHRLLCLFIATVLLSGCATTRLTQVTVASKLPDVAFNRLLVLGPPALAERDHFEQVLARTLAEQSASEALAGSLRLDNRAAITPEMISAAARDVGADGVLTVVPVDLTAIYHAAPVGLYPYYGFYPLYTVPVMRFDVLRLDIRLYALDGREPLWQGLSETIDPSIDLAAQLALSLAAELSSRGLLKNLSVAQGVVDNKSSPSVVD